MTMLQNKCCIPKLYLLLFIIVKNIFKVPIEQLVTKRYVHVQHYAAFV